MKRRAGLGSGAWPLAALLLLAATACQDESGASARRAKMSQVKSIEFTSVGRGPFGVEAARERLRSPVPGGAIARGLGEARERVQPRPLALAGNGEESLARVDFARQSIVAVTLGETGSAGSNIELVRIEPGPPPVLVMKSTHPGPTDMVAAMVTHPFHLVIVNAAALAPTAIFTLDGKRTEFERHVFE